MKKERVSETEKKRPWWVCVGGGCASNRTEIVYLGAVLDETKLISTDHYLPHANAFTSMYAYVPNPTLGGSQELKRNHSHTNAHVHTRTHARQTSHGSPKNPAHNSRNFRDWLVFTRQSTVIKVGSALTVLLRTDGNWGGGRALAPLRPRRQPHVVEGVWVEAGEGVRFRNRYSSVVLLLGVGVVPVELVAHYALARVGRFTPLQRYRGFADVGRA